MVDAADTLSDKGRRGGDNKDDNDGCGGGKMEDVIKVAAVLDESDKGGSGVNNNIYYDVATFPRFGLSRNTEFDT